MPRPTQGHVIPDRDYLITVVPDRLVPGKWLVKTRQRATDERRQQQFASESEALAAAHEAAHRLRQPLDGRSAYRPLERESIRARRDKLTAEERRESARKAARARWGPPKP